MKILALQIDFSLVYNDEMGTIKDTVLPKFSQFSSTQNLTINTWYAFSNEISTMQYADMAGENWMNIYLLSRSLKLTNMIKAIWWTDHYWKKVKLVNFYLLYTFTYKCTHGHLTRTHSENTDSEKHNMKKTKINIILLHGIIYIMKGYSIVPLCQNMAIVLSLLILYSCKLIL